ncbi:mycothiol transferase [Pilimelia columellifera]|uniref:DinB family protein n=1 Tax=Pilimelia columellifera subsp. columellifera TaxID=706583 RepID=A0ABP6AI81_9ACTN
MNVSELLVEQYGRLPDLARAAVEELTPDQLRFAPAAGANPIGWLVWHLTRVQDSHIAEITGQDQVWAGGDWATRFGLAADPDDTGYGHTPEQVSQVRPRSWKDLAAYLDAVAARTDAFLRALADDDLDRVVDESWDPPVTLGVRLVSIADDDLQHAGQAAYVRGLLAADR